MRPLRQQVLWLRHSDSWYYGEGTQTAGTYDGEAFQTTTTNDEAFHTAGINGKGTRTAGIYDGEAFQTSTMPC